MNDFRDMLINYFTQEELNKIRKTKIVIAGCGD